MKELKEAERKLASYVAKGHGKETVKSLRAKGDNAFAMSQEKRVDGDDRSARAYQNKADKLDEMASDTHAASKLVEKYGAHPYGDGKLKRSL